MIQVFNPVHGIKAQLMKVHPGKVKKWMFCECCSKFSLNCSHWKESCIFLMITHILVGPSVTETIFLLKQETSEAEMYFQQVVVADPICNCMQISFIKCVCMLSCSVVSDFL